MHKTALTYSLFGDNPLYHRGMIANCRQKQEIYPDADLLVFHDDTVPTSVLRRLENEGATWLIDMSKRSESYNNPPSKMLWRYLPIDPSLNYPYDVILARDADSRLTQRERWAVDYWRQTSALVSTIHDSISHHDVMGGLTNVRCVFHGLAAFIETWARTHDGPGHDQGFLNSVLRPVAGDSLLTIKGIMIPVPYGDSCGAIPGHLGCCDVDASVEV